MHYSSAFAATRSVEMLPFSEMDVPVQGTVLAQPVDGLANTWGGSCILVVDDDPAILMLVSKMVFHLGFRLKTAVDGLDALETMRKHTCGLVITDDEMPAMDGYQLAEQIHKRHGGTPVIIMSGFQEGERLAALAASGLVAGTLLKPFNLNMLKNAIKMVKDQGPDRWVC
jgi:CheY-like chemotaxis protein